MPPLLITSDAYQRFDYGPTHPLQVNRLRLTVDLIEAFGLLRGKKARTLETRRATEEEVLTFHSRDYLQILKEAL